MASAPSASALTAVLRCRGKIVTRNQASKRPSCSVYRLGLTCGQGFESGHAISRKETSDECRTNRLLPQEKRLEVAGMTVSIRLESAGLSGRSQSNLTSHENSNTCPVLRPFKPTVKTFNRHHVQVSGRWLRNLNMNTFESIRHGCLFKGYDEARDSFSAKLNAKFPTVLCLSFCCKQHNMNATCPKKYESILSMSTIKDKMLGFSQTVSDLVLDRLRIFLKMSNGHNDQLIEKPESGKKGKDKKSWKDDSEHGT